MVPPILTDEDKGRVVDGTARSAEWRAKAARSASRNNASEHSGDGAAEDHNLYAPPTGYAGSIMVPADQLPLDSPDGTAGKQSSVAHRSESSSDPYMDNLIADGAAEARPQETPPGPVGGDDRDESETDRFFEQQAVVSPKVVARQTLGLGTAGLTIDSTPARRRRPQLRSRIARARLTRARHEEVTPDHDARPSGFGARRRAVLAAATALTMLAVAVTLVASSRIGSPPPDRGAAIASTRLVLLSALADAASAAERAIHKLAGRPAVARRAQPRKAIKRMQRHHSRRPAHHPKPRASSPPAVSTQPAASYTPAVTSGRSPPVTTSSSSPSVDASSSPSSGGVVSSLTQPASSSQTSGSGATSSRGSGRSSKPTAPAGPTGNGALLGPGHCNC
jgi:hypothetical protein